MPRSEPVLDHLRARRSVAAVTLVGPGPSAEELRDILTIAARVPDHGKLAPWRFIRIEGEALAAFRQRLMELWRSDHPEASEEAAEVEAGKRPQAPLLLVLVSRAGEHAKIPVWEQELSVGAAGMNLLHALHAHGYAGQWLSGWPAYDGRVGRLLGLQEGERVAGFVYAGTPATPPSDRDRPDVATLLTDWRPA
ncbi:nitroreductase family protein [Lutibaculum baratangense]|uniref:Putative NAD(P)H nitroreductase n=1 Tax=Lutibaculum baratangense AMV1 TaxID=631454 RepID=V4RBP1_9HYPH|nr:nitroreductase [Lutibaculum baratangense]ESR23571.1 Nitroreductase family protein [Lutibaculum baratangense AMV1]